jgi:hypothetical protein
MQTNYSAPPHSATKGVVKWMNSCVESLWDYVSSLFGGTKGRKSGHPTNGSSTTEGGMIGGGKFLLGGSASKNGGHQTISSTHTAME